MLLRERGVRFRNRFPDGADAKLRPHDGSEFAGVTARLAGLQV